MERISVIVPVYGVEAYLDRCVQSLLEQSYRDFELILVDDGSPDSCGAMCDAWAAKDGRIKVVHKENGGLSDARNAGLAVASGAYIAFVDSDDWVAPAYLASLYEALKAQKAEIAECAAALVTEDGAVLGVRKTPDAQVLGKMDALRRLVLEDGIYQTVWNKLYRRRVLEGIPFEKGKRHEDDFWTYQVFDRMDRLALVQEPLYHYLQRGGSIMGEGYTIKRLDGLEARFRRMEYLQKYEALAALTRQSLMMDCMWHYQSAKTHLSGREQKAALQYVRQIMKRCPAVPLRALTGKLTHRVWYLMFRIVPDLTVWVRNVLRIGI